MSSDLAVPRIGPASPAASTAREPPAETPDIAPRSPTAIAFPNPTLRLDAGLAIVVIEFRDDSGAVRSTLPTQQQLEAYRSWERSQMGTPPPGTPSDAIGQPGPAPAPGAAVEGPSSERAPRAPDISPPASPTASPSASTMAGVANTPDAGASDVNGLETLAD